MLILGVDPGTAVTGFGVVRMGSPHALVECGVIRTKAERPLPETDATYRLALARTVERSLERAHAMERRSIPPLVAVG